MASVSELELPQYKTSNKTGLLVILIKNEFKRDKELALSFFEKQLGFEVTTYDHNNDLQEFISDVKRTLKTNAWKYYCLVFLISCHGDETEMEIGNRNMSMGEFAKQFSNENLKELAGRPKVFVADCCRGGLEESEVCKSKEYPTQPTPPIVATQDSDLIFVFATTNGKKAWVERPMKTSVLVKKLIETLSEKWESSHLEEMLIIVRNKVVNWTGKSRKQKQTAEVITTLTKALTFKSSQLDRQKW